MRDKSFCPREKPQFGEEKGEFVIRNLQEGHSDP